MILDRSIARLKCDASAHYPEANSSGLWDTNALVRFWARIGKTDAQ